MTKGQTQLDADNLPLSVREHLMRGQHDDAVSVLGSEHGLSEDEAKQLIEAYRQVLRERKIALDIQIMNDQQAKEAREQYHFYWLWGSRLALLACGVLLIYVLASTL